jgi:hypothetical protein
VLLLLPLLLPLLLLLLLLPYQNRPAWYWHVAGPRCWHCSDVGCQPSQQCSEPMQQVR